MPFGSLLPLCQENTPYHRSTSFLYRNEAEVNEMVIISFRTVVIALDPVIHGTRAYTQVSLSETLISVNLLQ
jgi:hypothetical protein